MHHTVDNVYLCNTPNNLNRRKRNIQQILIQCFALGFPAKETVYYTEKQLQKRVAMNETGNILQNDYAYMKYGPKSTSMMYIDVIASLQQRIDTLEGLHENDTKEKALLRGSIEAKDLRIEKLLHEIRDLNTALEIERAYRQQEQQKRAPSAKQHDAEWQDSEQQAHKAVRRQKQQAINPDTVARLKNDRRHYAAVCDAALAYWQQLLDNDLVDPCLRLTARCGITVAARIACCFQNVVDPNIRWSFFEWHWKTRHLQSNLHRSTYRDEKKYVLVNRIFGRADDAPFIPKSQLEDT